MNENPGLNRAKFYQLALFPMNNGATNVYFVLILSYIASFGSNVLGLVAVFASLMVTGMRVFDAITDPIIGALMDQVNTRFGKFRPFMVIGNLIMAVSVILLYMVTPVIPETMMIVGYVFSAPFFVFTVRTSQKHGQKKSLITYVRLALICYVGVLVLLLLWKPGYSATTLTLWNAEGLNMNLYTIVFILLFGVGYGAYYATADMPIPMVADCADYETYRSGRFIPGVMGTMFSLVDKLVSSLAATVVSIALLFIGIDFLPLKETPYAPGMNGVVIVCFCIIPMVAWALSLWAMKGYELDCQRLKTIQAVNAARKSAISGGMSLEEAMRTFTDETITK